MNSEFATRTPRHRVYYVHGIEFKRLQRMLVLMGTLHSNSSSLNVLNLSRWRLVKAQEEPIDSSIRF